MAFARTLSIVPLAAMLVVGTPSASLGTSCAPLPLQDTFELAPYVFVGKVVKLEIVKSEDGGDTIEATVEVGEIFKGDLKAQVKFITETKRDYHTFWFYIATEYLFFASERDGYFVTGPCSRSGSVRTETVDEDLRQLRTGALH